MHQLIYQASVITGSYYHNLANPTVIRPVEVLSSLQRQLVHSEKVTSVREVLLGIEDMLLELVSD